MSNKKAAGRIILGKQMKEKQSYSVTNLHLIDNDG